MSMIAKIVCPNCDFTTKIPQQHITASKKIARCPKCGQKFALNNKNIIWTTLSDSAPPTPSNDADSSIPEKEVFSENKKPHHLGKHASAEFNSAKQTSSPKIPKQIYRGGAKGVARDVFFFLYNKYFSTNVAAKY